MKRISVRLLLLGVIVLCSIAVPGAAVADAADDDSFEEFEDEFEAQAGEFDTEPIHDPLRAYNRLMFRANDKFYFWFLKPVASVYGDVVPSAGRESIRLFFLNLGFPSRLVHNTLQGKFKRSGIECARFAVNSTIGALGFLDPASRHFGLTHCPEDCGQTLGCYGIGGGFPFVIPLLGPSNLRDTFGKIPDYFLNPVAYLDPMSLRLSIRGFDLLNYTSLHLGEYEGLKQAGLDPDLFMMDAYRQSRNKKIKE